MERISLKGRAIVVTGAGRGLGRAYAKALAERGARVVVNDLGTDSSGRGTDGAVAQAVAGEITANGGEAVADANDVSKPEGGEAIIERALASFGRIDVVVSNAGSAVMKPFGDMTLADFEREWRVHVGGAINLAKAAWPYMVEQGSGRLILTGSGAGLFGSSTMAGYGSAKGAIHGLMRALAIEGGAHGILVNTVMPSGFSRLYEEAVAGAPQSAELIARIKQTLPPELVAPVIVWLASGASDVTGQTFSVFGGRVAQVSLGRGAGLYSRELTPELIIENHAALSARENYIEPDSHSAEVGVFLKELFQ